MISLSHTGRACCQTTWTEVGYTFTTICSCKEYDVSSAYGKQRVAVCTKVVGLTGTVIFKGKMCIYTYSM
jgi:hypothetical protein